ncbi:hypothetical protein [Kitasatospora sp. P5_F3]
MTVLLVGAFALAVGGCVCVVWADRGGPRWVQRVARATLGAGELVRFAHKHRPRGVNRSGDSGD